MDARAHRAGDRAPKEHWQPYALEHGSRCVPNGLLTTEVQDMATAPLASTDATVAITSDNHLLSLSKSVSVLVEYGGDSRLSRVEKIDFYVDAAFALNTKRSYGGDLRDFLNWGGMLPASIESLSSYVVDRAATHSPHTIARRLVGIGRAHTSQGLADPAKSPLVKLVLRGVRRRHAKPQRQAQALDRDELVLMLPRMVGTGGLRDRALMLLGFAAALRRSELVALNVEDLTFNSEGVVLQITRSKTDQVGIGRRIAVPYGRTAICPVRAVTTWLAHSNVESGAVFRSVGKSGVIGSRLSPQSVTSSLKAYARQVGLEATCISAHSLRAGFATSAARAGVPLHKIQQQTGHASLQMLSRYIRDGRLFADNACAALF